MDGIGFDEPNVAINSRALVKPSVTLRRVHAHQQDILSAGIGEIGDIETERIVAAAVLADVETVEDHHGLAVSAVELKRNPLALVRLGHFEDSSVPADARGWVIAAQRIETLAKKRGVVGKRQLDGPIVRQIERFPVAVVEGEGTGGEKAARLLKVAATSAAEPEVFGRVTRVAEMKAPSEIEQQAFTRRVGLRRFLRRA